MRCRTMDWTRSPDATVDAVDDAATAAAAAAAADAGRCEEKTDEDEGGSC